MSGDVYGATIPARILAFLLGLGLFAWTCFRIRRRVLLLSIGSLLISIGFGLIAFAVVPGVFDALAYGMGVKYPPVFYLLLFVVGMSAVLLHMAARISALDIRCRKLTQELALLPHERGLSSSYGVPEAHADTQPNSTLT
jgi:hypothetical protein